MIKWRLAETLTLAVSLSVFIEEGHPELAGAAVHVVPHELVGVAGAGLLPDLSHHGVPCTHQVTLQLD